MDFAISIPQYIGNDGFDDRGFRQYVQRAEELGFAGGWVQEQVLGPARTLAPLEALSYAAACTDRMRLGCAVFVTPLQNPVHLAKGIASVDHLSHGRLDVGVGTGGRVRPFAAFGVDPSVLVALFNEGLAVMKACWTESEINFDGRFWQLQGAAMEPKPAQKPYPPIWFGGNHPDALRRAVRLGDGFIGAGSQSTAQYAEQARVIREELERTRRDPTSFGLAKRVYIHVEDDEDQARARIEAALTQHYGRGGWSDVFVAGPPATCAAGLREVADAGAQLILLNPLADDLNQMERLAAEVITAL
jgi:probable F420-dependent oxidoreductase